MNRYRPEVPFAVKLPRPAPVYGPDSTADHLRMQQALDNLAPAPALRFRGVAEVVEFRDGYLAKVQARIIQKPAAEEPVIRRLRSMGQGK